MSAEDLPNFKDLFSASAAEYALYRPRYPEALLDFLASLCAHRSQAWDCATGNGQAALALAERFERVIATDASRLQIASALPHPKVTYRVSRAEESGLDSESADLVTVAQALHWLDLPAFYREVRRVAVAGGIFAAWSYSRLTVDPEVNPVISRFYEQVGPYWPPERAIVDRGYASIAFPFAEIEAPVFFMEQSWNLARLLGYVGTWSATRAFREAMGLDPVDSIREDLLAAWGDPASARVVRWPLAVRVGRL